MASSMIGSKVERTEDKKFITGKGRYTADITLHGQTHAFFIRSPHARAKIKKVDISKAEKAPGVVAILTGQDIVNDKTDLYWKNYTDEEFNIDEQTAISVRRTGKLCRRSCCSCDCRNI